MDDNQRLLSEAEALAQDERYEEARLIVRQLVTQDRHQIDGWWALAQLARTDKERRDALYHVLALDPQHMHANQMLRQITAGTLERLTQPIKREPPELRIRNYFNPALMTLMGYVLFWVVGLVMNLYFLNEARQLHHQPKTNTVNEGCLSALFIVFVISPVIITLLGLWTMFTLR